MFYMKYIREKEMELIIKMKFLKKNQITFNKVEVTKGNYADFTLKLKKFGLHRTKLSYKVKSCIPFTRPWRTNKELASLLTTVDNNLAEIIKSKNTLPSLYSSYQALMRQNFSKWNSYPQTTVGPKTPIPSRRRISFT